MSNEELAVLARQGDQQAVSDLWEAVRRLCFRLARRYASMLARAGYTAEDMEQECFLAFCAALEAFEPERGNKFTSYLPFHVQNAMRAALGIRHGGKLPPIPLSLDGPLDDAADADTRGELVPDPAAEQAFENAEERLYIGQLHDALEECIAMLEERPAAAIRARYYDGLTLAEAGACLGGNAEYARRMERKGLNGLRRARQLRQFREQLINEGAYHCTGLSAWRYGGSVQERLVERLERKGL